MAQLPSQSQFGDYGEWPGRDVLDSGGERLGGVREIYLDRETGRPEWVLVDIDGEQARFVPLANASVESSTIRVAHSADAIRRAPGIGAEPRIDQTEERKLYDHYGIGYSEDESGSGLPADEPPREPDATATTSDATEERPAAFVAPDPSDGGPDAPDTTDRSEPVTSSTGDDTPTSSWSAAADEPSNLAPAPADPPSAEELQSADIRQPAAGEDFTATTEPEPSFQASATVPSGGGEILAAGTAADAETDLKTSLGPDTVNVFSPPDSASQQPPPAQESGGALSAVKSRKGVIAAAVGLLAVLVVLLRRGR